MLTALPCAWPQSWIVRSTRAISSRSAKTTCLRSSARPLEFGEGAVEEVGVPEVAGPQRQVHVPRRRHLASGMTPGHPRVDLLTDPQLRDSQRFDARPRGFAARHDESTSTGLDEAHRDARKRDLDD
jgi:hypothetical protein